MVFGEPDVDVREVSGDEAAVNRLLQVEIHGPEAWDSINKTEWRAVPRPHSSKIVPIDTRLARDLPLSREDTRSDAEYHRSVQDGDPPIR
jgi:hypothetical protein